MITKKLPVIFILYFLNFAVNADEQAVASTKTFVNFSVSERQEVIPNLLTARLEFIFEGDKPQQVQNEINKTISKVQEIAKTFNDVEFTTESYNVYPYYPTGSDKKQKSKEIYKGSQSITIKSTASDKLLELAAKLQSMGLLMQGLNYSIGNSQIEEIKDGMVVNAIVKLQKKANNVARALNKKTARLAEINIAPDNYFPVRPLMAKSYAAETTSAMDMPIAAPGKTEVTLTINARAELE